MAGLLHNRFSLKIELVLVISFTPNTQSDTVRKGNNTLYQLKRFNYLLNQKVLVAENVSLGIFGYRCRDNVGCHGIISTAIGLRIDGFFGRIFSIDSTDLTKLFNNYMSTNFPRLCS